MYGQITIHCTHISFFLVPCKECLKGSLCYHSKILMSPYGRTFTETFVFHSFAQTAGLSENFHPRASGCGYGNARKNFSNPIRRFPYGRCGRATTFRLQAETAPCETEFMQTVETTNMHSHQLLFGAMQRVFER